jgi:hypothetical protein
MAATNPRRDDDDYRSGSVQDDLRSTRSQRGAITTGTTPTRRRSIWMWVLVGLIVLAILGVIGYFALYNGSSYSPPGGTGGGAGGGGGGGGYFIVAFSAEQVRQLVKKLRR